MSDCRIAAKLSQIALCNITIYVELDQLLAQVGLDRLAHVEKAPDGSYKASFFPATDPAPAVPSAFNQRAPGSSDDGKSPLSDAELVLNPPDLKLDALGQEPDQVP